MTSPIPPEEELRKMARELEQLSNELRDKFDSLKQQQIHLENRRSFFSHNRKDFWPMPTWMSVPIVCFLLGLLIMALYTAYV